MLEYWSWWKGALALGGTTVVFVLLLDRMLGDLSWWAHALRTARRAG